MKHRRIHTATVCPPVGDDVLIDYVCGDILAADQLESIHQHLSSCSSCMLREQRVRLTLGVLREIDMGEETLLAGINADDLHDVVFHREVRRIAELWGAFQNAAVLHHDHLDSPSAAATLAYLVLGFDAGMSGIGKPTNLEITEASLEYLKRTPTEQRSLLGCVHLAIIEAAISLHREDYETAARHYSLPIDVQHHLRGRSLDFVAIAFAGRARCYAKMSHYVRAQQDIEAAIHMIGERFPTTAGAFRMLQGWIAFKLGDSGRAQDLLDRAKGTLATSDDHYTLGNICSAVGRIKQRDGKYEEAIAASTDAIEHLGRVDRANGNLARALVNRAFDRCLLSRTQPTLDRGSALSRAESDLDAADNLYENKEEHRRGTGRALLRRAWVFFERYKLSSSVEELDKALNSVARAFELAKIVDDYALMARARIKQTAILLEQSIGDGRNERVAAARSVADDALRLVNRTDNRRLKAAANIWRAFVALRSDPAELQQARTYRDKAEYELSPGDQDYLRDDFRQLNAEIQESALRRHLPNVLDAGDRFGEAAADHPPRRSGT